jgi:hypothetical protein
MSLAVFSTNEFESLHRPQILRDCWAMQALAAEWSGYAGNSAAL